VVCFLSGHSCHLQNRPVLSHGIRFSLRSHSCPVTGVTVYSGGVYPFRHTKCAGNIGFQLSPGRNTRLNHDDKVEVCGCPTYRDLLLSSSRWGARCWDWPVRPLHHVTTPAFTYQLRKCIAQIFHRRQPGKIIQAHRTLCHSAKLVISI
jgi:hypothetical protein